MVSFWRPIVTKKAIPEVGSRKNNVKVGALEGYLKKSGLKPHHVPLGILLHEILGVIMLALTWSACYYLQPSSREPFSSLLSKLKTMNPAGMHTKNIPFVSGASQVFSSRRGVSYLESSLLRKAIRPLTLPGKLVLTVHCLKEYAKWEGESLTSPGVHSLPVEEN